MWMEGFEDEEAARATFRSMATSADGVYVILSPSAAMDEAAQEEHARKLQEGPCVFTNVAVGGDEGNDGPVDGDGLHHESGGCGRFHVAPDPHFRTVLLGEGGLRYGGGDGGWFSGPFPLLQLAEFPSRFHLYRNPGHHDRLVPQRAMDGEGFGIDEGTSRVPT